MKRDLDLVRSILLDMEAKEHAFVGTEISIEGFSAEQVGYHVFLMGQAGLIKAVETTAMNDPSPSAIPINLTWAGHDFLDSIKDDTVWKKAKAVVLKKAGGVAFDVLIAWLKSEAMQGLGLS